MTTAQRRTDILQILKKADAPIAAKELAAHFGVSRQVIVQDMAVIRVSVPGILSTTRGYVLQQDSGSAREFKVCHTPEQAADEMNLIVDLSLIHIFRLPTSPYMPSLLRTPEFLLQA